MGGSGIPVRLLHFWHSIAMALVYLIFSVIYDLAGGTNGLDKPYIYSLLDWSGDPTWASIYALGTMLVAVPLFWILLMWGFYQLRLLIVKSCKAHNQGKNQVV